MSDMDQGNAESTKLCFITNLGGTGVLPQKVHSLSNAVSDISDVQFIRRKDRYVLQGFMA